MVDGANRGSGCGYAAALIFAIAKGLGIADAARFSKEFAYDAIRNARRVGRGMPIVRAGGNRMMHDLAEAVSGFTSINGIHRFIPECQTNFVFSGANPRTVVDILGLEGRITRAGRGVVVAGRLSYGGSKHVGTALLEMSRRFPAVRSAVNIRYRDSTVTAMERAGMHVKSYDRSREPGDIKSDGSTVGWGVGEAARGLAVPPDAVFHRGDLGKEPMIIIFGRSPASVLEKVSKIATAVREACP